MIQLYVLVALLKAGLFLAADKLAATDTLVSPLNPVQRSVQSSMQGKIKFGTGMIGFQDMVAPLLYSQAFQARLRSDGLVPAEEMEEFYGVAAMFALGVSYQVNAYMLGYRLSHHNIAGVIDQTDAVLASYSNTNSDFTVAYWLAPKIKLGIGLVAERNIFSNLTEGYTLFSFAPLAELTLLAAPNTAVRGYADYSLLAYLGKYRNAELLGRRLHDATIKSGSVGFEVEHIITDDAVLFVAFEQSLARISVPDIGTYTRIPLLERIPSPRILSSRTRVFSVGLAKILHD